MEVKFCRPATLGEREARAAHAEWLADVESRIHVISAEVQGQGVDLTHKQAHALAGRWYRWKTDRHSEDPGAPPRWADEIRRLIEAIGRFAEDAKEPRSEPIVLKPITDLNAPGLRFAGLLGHATRPHSCAPVSRRQLRQLGFEGLLNYLRDGGLIDRYLAQSIAELRQTRNALMHQGNNPLPKQSGAALTVLRDVLRMLTGQEFELMTA